MAQTTQAPTRPAAEVIEQAAVSQSASGICYSSAGEIPLGSSELERMVNTVPQPIAAALVRRAFYFVPLTVSQGEETLIADRYDVALSESAVCHRNLTCGTSQCVFISTRLMDDKFSIAFEFFINVAHLFVEQAVGSVQFSELAWKQVEEGIRGETSLDAWELRKLGTSGGNESERARTEYFEAAFADSIAVYMLATFLDVDYHDLRERDYPLLAPAALGERLRLIQQLFPANTGYEFAVYYRRKQ
ncbi:MAG: hypothetical protein JO041_09920 [Acidobacteria bacterium]|nr:hypothetical protein [Acidobacteriota bacterium]